MVKRVIAFVMHENEMAIATNAMPGSQRTDGYVVGDADDPAIAQMQAEGIVVQELPAAPTAMGLAFANAIGAPALPGYYLVSFAPPILPECHRDVEATGAWIVDRRDDWYTVHVDNAPQLDALLALPWVHAVRPYDAAESLKQFERSTRPITATYDVVLHPTANTSEVEHWLTERGVTVVGRSRLKLRVTAGEDELHDIAGHAEVADVQAWRAPVLRLDLARARVGVEPMPQLPSGPLDGTGVVVGVCDSGLDTAHVAFQGAVIKMIARGRPNDGSDPHGHGTHVVGTIAGRATAQGASSEHQGIAPGAQIVMQSIMDSSGRLGGLPIDLNDLLREAYQSEVRIHNNSWGSDLGGAYPTSSREIDQFVWEHPDMLVVISAGNAGTCVDPAVGARKSGKGFVDWYSVGAPGTAKNALVVGASRSGRASGGLAQLRYRDVWPSAFPEDPIGEEKVSTDPQCIAGFSSRGFSDDQRIKPDVVAPGTDIAAPRASTAPAHNFSGSVPGTNRRYGYMSGTSMAAPVVAGVAALVRQWLQTARNHDPSAALLKAILINGAQPLTGADAVADVANLPNPHQGFGCVSLTNSIPLSDPPAFSLAFVDTWKDPALAFTPSGAQRHRWRFELAGAGELRITMAYTDWFARGLQNNLNVIVEVPGAPAKRVGNESLAGLGKLPDANNNVEVVRLQNAPAGQYYVSVTASNLLQSGQHYALVVTGPLAQQQLRGVS